MQLQCKSTFNDHKAHIYVLVSTAEFIFLWPNDKYTRRKNWKSDEEEGVYITTFNVFYQSHFFFFLGELDSYDSRALESALGLLEWCNRNQSASHTRLHRHQRKEFDFFQLARFSHHIFSLCSKYGFQVPFLYKDPFHSNSCQFGDNKRFIKSG